MNCSQKPRAWWSHTTETRHAPPAPPPASRRLAACSCGNVKSVKEYSAPAAPPVRNPLYNPYAAYGEANAIWQPPVFNRDGTVVKPAEPASQADRPGYEFAPWATGAAGGSQYAPPGTF